MALSKGTTTSGANSTKEIKRITYRLADVKDGGFAKNANGQLARFAKDANGKNVRPTAGNPGAGNSWQRTYKTDLRRVTEYKDGTKAEETPHFSVNVGVNNTGNDVADLMSFAKKARDMVAIGQAILAYVDVAMEEIREERQGNKPDAKPATKPSTVKDAVVDDEDDEDELDEDEEDGEDIDI